MSQRVRGWMEVAPSLTKALNITQSNCCKSIFSLTLTGEERGCSCYLLQLSKQALSNALPWESEAGNPCLQAVGPCVVRSGRCALCISGRVCLKTKDSFEVREGWSESLGGPSKECVLWRATGRMTAGVSPPTLSPCSAEAG